MKHSEEEEYESEQHNYNEDDNYMTEGEYLDTMSAAERQDHSSMMNNPQMTYLENESQDIDVNTMLDDIESSEHSKHRNDY